MTGGLSRLQPSDLRPHLPGITQPPSRGGLLHLILSASPGPGEVLAGLDAARDLQGAWQHPSPILQSLLWVLWWQ